MRRSWAQPSLSRDFALLSVVILFVLLLISGWVTYSTYDNQTHRITDELDKESKRIERTLSIEMENASYMLNALGHQIVLDPNRDYVRLAQVLKSFDSKGYIYTIFSWVNADQRIVVSSNKGVLEEPVDVSDRDYVQKGAVDAWKMHIGRPIEGRVSGRWVIPVAMGITDYTGKFIGTIMISIDISALTEQISSLVKRDGISFAVVSKSLIPLTQVSENKNFVTDNFPTQKLVDVDLVQSPTGLISQGSLFWGTGSYAFYRVSEVYPYIIMLGYDANFSDESVRTLLWSRLMQLVVMATFFLLMLWIVRVKVIKPVLDMTTIVADVANGKGFTPLPKTGAIEIEGLAAQVHHMSEYINETKRIEDELRNKMFMLKKAKEAAEINVRHKSEFLAYISQEMRVPLNNVIGFAQVLKDQLYGPIENKKYRQYATDIFATGNQLIGKMQDILLHSKAETGYIALNEKPLDISTVVNASLRQLTDKLQTEKSSIRVNLQEGVPRIIADDFRLQQIVMNMLLVGLDSLHADGLLRLEAKLVSEHREKRYLALIVASDEAPELTPNALLLLANQSFSPTDGVPHCKNHEGEADLRLKLAESLISLHGGCLTIEQITKNSGSLIAFFPSLRLHFQDGSED